MKIKAAYAVCVMLSISMLAACGYGGMDTPKKTDSLADMAVEINGSTLQIYGTANEFMQNNWKISYTENDKKKVDDLGELYATITNKEDENQEINVLLKNWEDDAVKVNDAQIARFSISHMEEIGMKIKLPKKITEKSTIRDVIKAYGQPSAYYVNSFMGSVDSYLIYESKGDYQKRGMITFSFENTKLKRVDFEGAEKKKKANKSTVFTFKDVFGYKAFTDITEPSVIYDDVLLNGKVRIGSIEIGKDSALGTLMDEGWMIDSTYGDETTTEIYLTKDNAWLSVTAAGVYQEGTQIDKTMPIISINVQIIGLDDIEMVLPGGLNTSASAKDIMKQYGMAHSLYYTKDGLEMNYALYTDDYDIGAQTSFQYNKKGEMTDFSITFRK